MYRIFYAGRGDMPEATPDRMKRTDHGNKMCDVRMGWEWLTEREIDFPTTDGALEAFGYTYVGSTDLDDPEKIFHAYNFCDQAFADHIREVDATHTSMSVGDVLVEVGTGRVFFCDRFGFQEV